MRVRAARPRHPTWEDWGSNPHIPTATKSDVRNLKLSQTRVTFRTVLLVLEKNRVFVSGTKFIPR